MANAFRFILAIFLVLPWSYAAAQDASTDKSADKSADKPYANSTIARDAARYEAFLKKNWKPGGDVEPLALRTAATRLLHAGNEPRAASRNFAMAVVADERDAKSWLGLARALLAIKPDANRGRERYRLPVNASGSAYIAYQRASSAELKSEALAVLSTALRRRSYWRPAINALKASLHLVANPQRRQVYRDMVRAHGFRVLDYKIDSDSVRPRLCIKFSERLALGQIDFAKFVSVNGKDPQSINAQTRRLCIDGLTHGKRYEVQLRAGLPSAVGEKLLKNSALAVYVRDRTPAVRFTGRGYVLPNKGQQGIPLVTVNTDRVAVEVLRIGEQSLATSLRDDSFPKQLGDWGLEQIRNNEGASVYKGQMSVARRLNEDVTTAFPVSTAIPKLKPGVYALVAKPAADQKGANREPATQWFIVSDLGLTAFKGDDGVHAFVRSLESAGPVAGVKLRLIARNHEVLGTMTTDARGYARFAPGLARGEGGQAPAMLAARTGQGDYAFLDLTKAGFDLTDRGVKGREPPGPIDGYLYTDRGVYRPGEDVHLTGLVRDQAAKAASLPVTLIVTRPDGVEHRRYALTDEGLGGRSTTLGLARSAMTGTWRARLHADPKADPIADIAFLVEDFVPERMALDLKAGSKALSALTGGVVNVAGRYLYGPPAAGLALEGEVVVRASSKPLPGLAGYHFGDAEEQIVPLRRTLDDPARTGPDGKAGINIKLPALPKTARPLEAQVIIRMRESGGRTIERSLLLPVDLGLPRIGIKPAFKGKHIGESESAAFDILFVGADGKPAAAKGLKWELLRLSKNWQWYYQNGSWNHDAVTTTKRVATGTADALVDKPARIASRVKWGRYRLEVSNDSGEVLSTFVFNAGWWSEEGADSPEMLEIALDKQTYKPGDTAKLKIAAKQAGKALIAVLGGGLATMKQVDVAKGGAEVELTVDETWGPGVYVAAMLYRPMDRKAKRMPGRSIGVRWLAIDTASRTLKVDLDLPEKVKSGSRLSVPVKLTGLKPGEEARVTVAAVDVGILSLTRFKSPAPEKWFYAQRRMGVEIRDFYGRLIDGMRAERGALRSGGDGPGGGLAMSGAPPVAKPLALFSGIVKVGADASATVEFDLPEFTGAVRIMAVAWSAGKLGSAARDVIVRDPIALLASGPRFLTMGDEARLELDLHNVEGPAAAYKLTVTRQDDAGLKQSVLARDVSLKAGERLVERFKVKADRLGRLAYGISVTGPGGIDVKSSLAFEVVPPAADIRRMTVSTLKPGGSLKLTSDLFADLIPSHSKLTVNVGPAAMLDVPGILTALDRYPYGCAEQTTSRALPLLYANAMAVKVGIATDDAIKERVRGAIERVFAMQDASGAFGIWGPHDTDLWLTSYVTDFLTRARESGYKVRELPMRQALDKLKNFTSYVEDFEKGGEDLAYALYVLARNGRAPIGELRYYVDTRLERFSTPLARAQLGAALAMMGDKVRAQTAFRSAMAAMQAPDTNLSRVDYGSGLRDGAALLTLVSESGMAKAQTAGLIDVVAKAYAGKTYTSTQEQAWMLLAARALSQKANTTMLSIDGKASQGAFMHALSAQQLSAGAMTITNTGKISVGAVVSVMGAALTREPAISKGFTIERSYYTLDGKPVDLRSADGGKSTLKQNDRLIVVLKIEKSRSGGRVLLVDRLPAGLEIENPRLVDSADLKSLPWLKTTVRPKTTQFRDDRFVAAFDFFGNRRGGGDAKSATVAYMVRAVTPGSFVHPAATVEDMYRPEHFARTASGRLTVAAPE